MLATLDLDALVTAPEAQVHPGLKHLRVCRHTMAWWVTVGKLKPRGRRGRSPLYRFGDLLEIERDARPVGLRRRKSECRSCLRAAEREAVTLP